MLKDKIVFITGSSRGIGLATARLAKRYGARVILHGKSNSLNLVQVSEEIESPFVTFDVTDEDAIDQAFGLIGKSHGKIDILVNNAGFNPSKKFRGLTSRDWHDIYGTNLFGVVNVCRATLDHGMKEGSIVNIASVKGFGSVSGKPAYASAKAAVMRLTSSMAEEFAPHIRVNCVAPGFTDTEMTSSTLSREIEAQIGRVPMKRLARPEEIAEAVLFLASSKASFITGQTLTVDGGYTVAG